MYTHNPHPPTLYHTEINVLIVTKTNLKLFLESSDGLSRQSLCHALHNRLQSGGLDLRVSTLDHLTQSIMDEHILCL